MPITRFKRRNRRGCASWASQGRSCGNHEINVTPFIDVVLVLLIIFMVAAPLATVDLPVDLPASNAAPHEKPDKPVYVTIQADLALALGEMPVKRKELEHVAQRARRG